VPVAIGDNQITAVAVDAAGNEATHTINLTRMAVPAGVPTLQLLAGDGQNGAVATWLDTPLTVQVLTGDGSPMVNKLVTFTVARSDGALAASPDGAGSYIYQAHTDSAGEAHAFWRLGSDAGVGNNRVEVTSGGVVGSVTAVASAHAGPASTIVISSGDNQVAQTGGVAPLPLIVRVTDGQNPVGDVPVTFTVLNGDGQVNGEPATVVTTDPAGAAAVTFTLGSNAGAQRVRADFPGNPGLPAIFSATARASNPLQLTSFSGRVLDNAGRPIGGAGVLLFVDGLPQPTANTTVDGHFTVIDIPSGMGELHIVGGMADTLDGRSIPPNTFPSLHFEDFVIIPGADNALPTSILLPAMNPANARQYSTTPGEPTVLECEGIEGLRMIVEPGSMTLSNGTPAPDGTTVSINQVHFDSIPMPLPDGLVTPFAWTLQPAAQRSIRRRALRFRTWPDSRRAPSYR
jgi:hypothetical protein